MKTNRVEKTFPLPAGSDADIVAETVRAIIASSVSTERLVLETSPSLSIKAIIHMPIIPEVGYDDSGGLWDSVMGSVRLEELPTIDHPFPEDVFPLVTLCAAIQFICQKKRVPVGVLMKSKEEMFRYFGIKMLSPRLLGLPVFTVDQMDEDAVVIISSPSESLGPMRADHGVVFHTGGRHGGQDNSEE